MCAVRAFSLIEVVMAVAVVSFALLGMVALIPTGLMEIQSAETMQATSNIANQLRGQFQMLSFCGSASTSQGTISQLLATNYYYGQDGLPVEAPGFYKASFSLAGNVSPGGSAVSVVDASFATNNAVSITVTLSYPPGLLDQKRVFSILVARQTVN